MYEKRYGLTRRPFSLAAASACYYPATAHERTLRAAADALCEGAAFVVIWGGPGVGKSLLAHRLIDLLDRERQSLWLVTPFVTDAVGLYQAVLYDLELPYEGQSEQSLRLQVVDLLLKAYRAGRPMLWLLDEAQHLQPRVLEELRLLSGLEAHPGRAVQVVLVGQPELPQMLRRTGRCGIAQRVGAWLELPPMDLHESVDYMVHHVRAAGGRPERLLTPEALELLARGSQGVPRVLSQAADRAFQLAASADADTVDAEAAIEALAELGLCGEPDVHDGPRREAA